MQKKNVSHCHKITFFLLQKWFQIELKVKTIVWGSKNFAHYLKKNFVLIQLGGFGSLEIWILIKTKNEKYLDQVSWHSDLPRLSPNVETFCWYFCTKLFVKTFCQGFLLRLFVKTFCRDFLSRLFVETFCWDFLSRLFVETSMPTKKL